jgi:starch synthase
LLNTIRAALTAYQDRAGWTTLMRNGMAKDFSWNNSAREYVRVYEKARQLRAVDKRQVVMV